MSPDATASSLFKVRDGQRLAGVHPTRNGEASQIDRDQNQILDDAEIKDYLTARHDLEDPAHANVDAEKVIRDFKFHLRKEQPPQQAAYHTYEQIGQELEDLARRFPYHAERVSIGKTPEGREIWAMHITSGVRCGDTTKKTGVVFTGAHHAREWMSMEAPLFLAKELAEGYASDPEMRRRVDTADIWIIPCANPDGYEYSRTEDSWWRKNRNPITDTGCSGRPPNGAVGVDMNRNYDDGTPEHAHIYRPAGDLPCRTDDDFGRATSDDPHDDTYRGPRGASESEVRALQDLELKRGNIKGIIDHHGYGQMILYPWGNTRQPVENVAEYRRIGNLMNAAAGNNFRVMQSIELYPTSGGSHDVHHANGIMSMTLEIGRSFQPDPDEIDPIRRYVAKADLVFLDEVVKKNTPPPEPPKPASDEFLLTR